MNPPFIHYDISLSIQEKSYEKKRIVFTILEIHVFQFEKYLLYKSKYIR